jgi:hemolysin activation/secretion protein
MSLYFSQKLVARRTRTGRIAAACFSFLSVFACFVSGEESPSDPELPPPLPVTVTAAETARAAETRDITFPVRQIRVRGAKILTPEEIADAIYPYLGMGRTLEDLESARASLEKAYRDKGYETVGVELPVQNGTRGIIYMDAVENSVGRLRVRGAKYFLPSEVKKNAPSLQEGTVPDFAQVQEDIVKLNAWSDRRITPSLLPGRTPGTIDVDLLVEDSLPLHGSIELNNRYSAGTTPLRLNGSINYDNLWQLGHSLGLSTQIAPERIEDAEVYSAYYIARFAQAPNFSILLSGTKQNSDVSTLGGAAVAGRGEIAGIRALVTLPGRGKYFHSLSTGFDYKKFEEDVTLDGESFSTPIDYWPASLAYSGGVVNEKSFTEINALASWHFRGLGSSALDFDNKRFEADGSYLYFRGDVSHTQDFDNGFQAFGKIQGQATSNALINSEQYSGGGTSTVRGYLESEALADSGWFLTAELRTPSLLKSSKDEEDNELNREWRFHAFWDGGRLYLNHPLPEQIDLFPLSSWGVGTRFSLNDALEGSVEVAWPLQDQGATQAGEPFVTFQLEAGF